MLISDTTEKTDRQIGIYGLHRNHVISDTQSALNSVGPPGPRSLLIILRLLP